MLLRTVSRAWFVVAALAVLATGGAIFWGLLNITIGLDAPLGLAYPGGKVLAVYLVVSAPLVWLCRARARDIGVKPDRVLAVWLACSVLLATHLAILWDMGRSWMTASGWIVIGVSCVGVAAIGLAVGALLWLALMPAAAGASNRSGP